MNEHTDKMAITLNKYTIPYANIAKYLKQLSMNLDANLI